MDVQAQQPAEETRRYQVRLRTFKNHPGQTALMTTQKKRVIVRAGRRGGKTTGAAMIALDWFLKGKRVLYATPTIDQVQKFWSEVKQCLAEALEFDVYRKNETNHTVEKIGTDARIRAKTAWNADTLRGDFADLLILDEWQLMDETAWTEVGAPMLIDRNGSVVFIYTPPSLESRSASKANDPQHAAKMYKQRKSDPNWLCIHFPSSANPHISREGLKEVTQNMTAMAYRQEILAEDTEEIPGALWTRQIIEDSRVDYMPCDPRRIVVAIDPSGGNTTEVGICVAAEGVDSHFYILRDGSMLATRPKEWASAAVWLYHQYEADRIIGERNYGGDMVEETLRNVDESVSYMDVVATKGKMVRAEPVLALFQRKQMHIVGQMPLLEEELCSYTADPRQKSPNRLDAMVWCGIELSGKGALGLIDFFKSGMAKAMVGKTMLPAKRPVLAEVQVMHMSPEERAEYAAKKKATEKPKDTPTCAECGHEPLQVVAGGQLRCQACGHQQWPHGLVPAFPYAKRDISVQP